VEEQKKQIIELNRKYDRIYAALKGQKQHPREVSFRKTIRFFAHSGLKTRSHVVLMARNETGTLKYYAHRTKPPPPGPKQWDR